MSRSVLSGLVALVVLLVLTLPALAADVRGTIVMLDPDDYLLTVSDDLGGPHNFRLRVDGQVLINGAAQSIWNLRYGDRVQVTYESTRNGLVATMIRCARDANVPSRGR